MSAVLDRLREADSAGKALYLNMEDVEHLQDAVTALRAEVARLRQREKDLTLEGLALVGRLEQVREILAGTDIGSLPSDYPTTQMAQDRMAEIERLRTERDEQVQWVKSLADDLINAETKIERLRAALETAQGDLYNAANAWNDEDYRGTIPSCKGEFTAHSVDNQKRLVDWICTRAEAITTALEEKL